MFGEEFLESADSEAQTPRLVERPETSDAASIMLEARGNLSKLRPVLDSGLATKYFLNKLY